MSQPAARWVLLACVLGLSGCSLWPWHHHQPAAVVLPTPQAGLTDAAMAATARRLPAAAIASTVAAPAASADAGLSAVDTGQAPDYRPFSPSEWQQLWAGYRSLAQCTDRYMTSAGINGDLLGVQLVALQQDQQVVAQARRLLGPQLPPWAADAPLAARARQASHAVWLLMQDQPGLGLGQVLARKALARYDLALVSGTACPLNSGYHSLLTKALR